MDWPFDQAKNAATISTKQVIVEGYPVLRVVHYSDDHSWAFTCGTTNDSADAMVVGMGEVVAKDPTLLSVADLPPGWRATRSEVGEKWVRQSDSSI